jgi:hypothetical protein
LFWLTVLEVSVHNQVDHALCLWWGEGPCTIVGACGTGLVARVQKTGKKRLGSHSKGTAIAPSLKSSLKDTY